MKVPTEMYEEVLEGHDDELLEWVKNDSVRAALELQEISKPEAVQRVMKDGYADDLTDVELEKIGRDCAPQKPFPASCGTVLP